MDNNLQNNKEKRCLICIFNENFTNYEIGSDIDGK